MTPDQPANLHRAVLTTPPAPGAIVADADDIYREPDQVADAMRGWLNQRQTTNRNRLAHLTLQFVDGREVIIEWTAPNPTAANLEHALRNTRPAIQALDGNHYHTWRRQLGPFGLYAAKEVGPPPWPIPKVGLWVNRRRFHALVGWRSTAYHASATPGPAAAAILVAAAAAAVVGAWAARRRAQ